MGVDLRRSKAGMPEELLDDPQVCAPVEEVGGIGVSKRVWVRRLESSSIEDSPDVALAKSPTSTIEQQGSDR